MGAFRTYPEDYTPPNATTSEYQNVPLSKIEDFGVHSNKYYPLEVSYFKSALDSRMLEQLWKKYWAATLSSSDLLTSWGYISNQVQDLAKKIEKIETSGIKNSVADKGSKNDSIEKAVADR